VVDATAPVAHGGIAEAGQTVPPVTELTGNPEVGIGINVVEVIGTK
jgi:hypothetical protein